MLARRNDSVLRAAAVAETVTLVVLLVNLATSHTEAITATVGPLHGLLYLVAGAATVLARWTRRWPWWFVALGLLPAAGAVLVLERLRREPAPA